MITNDIQEFCLQLGSQGIILGVDFGTKKLGIAMSNQERSMALPLKVISPEMREIEAVIQQYKPCGLVIGLPMNMDGTNGAQADIVRKFAQKIADRFELPIFLQDERLTTRAAGNLLRDLGLNRKQCDERDDQVAAAMILETVLGSIKNMHSSCIPPISNKLDTPLSSARKASKQDIEAMVALSYLKRLDYEKAQPQFWRYAQGAEEIQRQWFEELLIREDHLCLIAEFNSDVIGFIIGRLVKAPEVYNPGGLTLMIDDFCVNSDDAWPSVGKHILRELKKSAAEKGASQTLVVCGAHDKNKRAFLRGLGLAVTSEWYVGGMGG